MCWSSVATGKINSEQRWNFDVFTWSNDFRRWGEKSGLTLVTVKLCWNWKPCWNATSQKSGRGLVCTFFWQCRRSGRRKVWPRQRRSNRLAKFLFNSDWRLISTDLLHCQSLYCPLMCICSVRPLTSLVPPVFSCFDLGWKVSLLCLSHSDVFVVLALTHPKVVFSVSLFSSNCDARLCFLSVLQLLVSWKGRRPHVVARQGQAVPTPRPPWSGEAQPRMPRLHMVGRYGHLLGWKGEGQIKCWLHRAPFSFVEAFQAKSWQKMLQTKSSYPLTWHGSLRVLKAIA